MSENWKPYPGGRVFLERPEGYLVIKPEEELPYIPLGCELCKILYRSEDDEVAHLEFGCCNACAMRFAHPDRNRWKDGWRPTIEQVQEDLKNRSKILVKV